MSTTHPCHGVDPRGRVRCAREATEVAWRMGEPHAFCKACAGFGISMFDQSARMPAPHEMTPTLLLAFKHALEEREEQLASGIREMTVQAREARAWRESAMDELARRASSVSGEVITR